MGSFVVLSMMGLWPVPGQDVYLITPPYFREVNITNGITGKVATVRNVNFDSNYESIYIQSVTWNGKPWPKNWVTHDFFAEGGVLELELGTKESKWGTNIKDLPPSLSDYHA
jgi:putative alpha-1,2-mannosidase